MTTASSPRVTNSVSPDPQGLFNDLKVSLRDCNHRLELLGKLAETSGNTTPKIVVKREKVKVKVKKDKTKVLSLVEALANKLKERIDQLATRSTLDGYREIVSLVQLLTNWSNDDDLALEAATAQALQVVAQSASETKRQVRSQLVGSRESRAREQMALAAVARELLFVRVIPLLHAQMLWAEVAEIVQDIEKPPELAINQADLKKLNTELRDELIEVQEQDREKEAKRLEAQWRTAKDASDDATIEKTYADFRQIVYNPAPLSDYKLSQDFLDAFWKWQDESIARKMMEMRVQGLVRRGSDKSQKFDERSSALKEAAELAPALTEELQQEVADARETMRKQASDRFNNLLENFKASKKEPPRQEAIQILEEMAQVAPYCEDAIGAETQTVKLRSELRPSKEERVVREFVAFLGEVEGAEDKSSALGPIEDYKRRMPDDLYTLPFSLRTNVVEAATRVLKSLPPEQAAPSNMPDIGVSGSTRRRYLEDIKRRFDASIRQSRTD